MDKHTPGPMPPFPKAIYGCDSCLSQGVIESNSYPPEELLMVTNPPKSWDPGWYCLPCADEVLYQNSQTQIGETLEHYLGLERDRLKALNAELLAALKAAKKIVDKWCHYQGNTSNLRETYIHPIDRVIAKAEGRD